MEGYSHFTGEKQKQQEMKELGPGSTLQLGARAGQHRANYSPQTAKPSEHLHMFDECILGGNLCIPEWVGRSKCISG